MTTNIRNRHYPWTYTQSEYARAKVALLVKTGPCAMANGHCVHSRAFYVSATSMAGEQREGREYWCCLCPVTLDATRMVRR